MSVFTTVDIAALQEYLTRYSVGNLLEYKGITAGIENTNYFVTTDQMQLVLTLFEHHQADDLNYFLDLMGYLADNGLPTAHPIADNQGNYLSTLCNKPSALVRRLSGVSIEKPNIAQIKAIAEALAKMHQLGLSFPKHRNNDRDRLWWEQTFGKLAEYLGEEDKEIIKKELYFQRLYHLKELPRGVIHSDLFCDNALFEGDKLTGIIDFYYACNDILLYDVAVTVNQWCSQADGQLDFEKVVVFLDHYHPIRPLLAIERGAWPAMLRAGALRFWLSRLYDWYFPRHGELTFRKDPNEFKQILLHRRQEPLQQFWLSLC